MAMSGVQAIRPAAGNAANDNPSTSAKMVRGIRMVLLRADYPPSVANGQVTVA